MKNSLNVVLSVNNCGVTSANKAIKLTSFPLLFLRFNATLAQNNQLRSGGLAGRYVSKG